jgi:transposase
MDNYLSNKTYGIAEKYLIPDAVWEFIKTVLPLPKQKKKSGRPRMDDHKAMTAILYVLRTGCQWNALPRSLGASSTVHDRFCEWNAYGVFERMWQMGLKKYDEEKGIDWEWQSLDGAMVKAPLGKKRMRPGCRRQSYRQRQAGHQTQFADRRKRDAFEYSCSGR